MTEPEPRYTLEEARQMIRDERCAQGGHELSSVNGNHNQLRCARCRRTFRLVVQPS